MNKQRRNEISNIGRELIVIKKRMEHIQDLEINAFENMPENLQNSLKGNESEDAIDTLDECLEKIGKIINMLYEIV